MMPCWVMRMHAKRDRHGQATGQWSTCGIVSRQERGMFMRICACPRSCCMHLSPSGATQSAVLTSGFVHEARRAADKRTRVLNIQTGTQIHHQGEARATEGALLMSGCAHAGWRAAGKWMGIFKILTGTSINPQGGAWATEDAVLDLFVQEGGAADEWTSALNILTHAEIVTQGAERLKQAAVLMCGSTLR